MFKSVSARVREHWILVLVLFLLIIMSLPLLYFWNLLQILNRQEGKAFPDSQANKVSVGVCFSDFLEARWLKERQAMLEEAGNLKLFLNIKVAHHSLARQTQQILNFINQDVKVLIINPVESSGLNDVLEEARRKGIKIIQYDELTAGPVDLFIGVDYREIGRMQATRLFQDASSKNYLIFKGPKDSYKAETMYSGILDSLKKRHSNQANITTDALPQWSADAAVSKLRMLIARQKLDGILAPDDLIAGEVINFIKEQKLPLPPVTGAGAEVTACQRILKNEQLVTFYFDYHWMAEIAIMYAGEFINHKTPLLYNAVVFNGKNIPAYLFQVEPVTKSNLKSLLVDQKKLYTEADLVSE